MFPNKSKQQYLIFWFVSDQNTCLNFFQSKTNPFLSSICLFNCRTVASRSTKIHIVGYDTCRTKICAVDAREPALFVDSSEIVSKVNGSSTCNSSRIVAEHTCTFEFGGQDLELRQAMITSVHHLRIFKFNSNLFAPG